MGKKLECYFYEESMFPITGGKSTKYIVSKLEPTGNLEHIVYDIQQVAREADCLFSKDGSKYIYDSVVIYSSLDDNIKGKPCVVATREGTIIRGINNSSDILFSIRYEVDNIVRQLKSTEHDIGPVR